MKQVDESLVLQPAWLPENEEEAAVFKSSSKLEKFFSAFETNKNAPASSDSESELALTRRHFSVLPSKRSKRNKSFDRGPVLIVNSGRVGDPTAIQVSYMGLANKHAHPKSRHRIVATQMHPKPSLRSRLCMTASCNGVIQLFDLKARESKEPSLLNSYIYERTRICDATFDQRGTCVYSVCRNQTLQIYDLESDESCSLHMTSVPVSEQFKSIVSMQNSFELLFLIGKSGRGYFVDSRTNRCVDSVLGEGGINCAVFDEMQPETLHAAIPAGNCIYDIRSLSTASSSKLGSKTSMVDLWSHPSLGVLGAQSMAVSTGKQRYLACGTAHGYVEVFDLASVGGKSSAPVEPLMELGHLRTRVDCLAFDQSSSDWCGQLLAYSSSDEIRALRLYDVTNRKAVNLRTTPAKTNVCRLGFADDNLLVACNDGRVCHFKCHS